MTAPSLYCPQCGYNLTGLTEHRCPECGQDFDPEKLAAHIAAFAPPQKYPLRLLLVPVVALVVAFLFGLVASLFARHTIGLILMPLLFMALLFAAFLHSLKVAIEMGESIEVHRGTMNKPWYFDMVLPVWVLFFAVEFVLSLVAISFAGVFAAMITG